MAPDDPAKRKANAAAAAARSSRTTSCPARRN